MPALVDYINGIVDIDMDVDIRIMGIEILPGRGLLSDKILGALGV